MLTKQQKIFTLAMQINILTKALRWYFDEDIEKDYVLEMIEVKSKLIRKLSNKMLRKIEFG